MMTNSTYIFINRYLILGWVILFASLNGYGSDKEVFVVPSTPFFQAPTIHSLVVHVAADDRHYQILETKRYFIKKNPIIKRSWHPLMTVVDFHRVRLDDRKDAWVSEDLLYDQKTRRIVPRPLPDINFQYCALTALLLMAVLLYALNKTTKILDLWKTPGIWPLKSSIIALCVLILLRLFLLFLTLTLSGKVILNPVDELGYFTISRDLIDCHISAPWQFTLGLGIFHLPLVWLLKARSYFDLVFPISIINSCVLVPLTFCMVFYIIQKISCSTRNACVALSLWATLPFFYFPVELHHLDVAKSLFAEPDFSAASYRLYYIFHAIGYNGLSDTPSAFFVISCFFLIIAFPPKTRLIIIVSAIFAFSCLIRLNNIFFSPLIAYLLWDKKKSVGEENILHIIASASIAVIVFLVCFSPQLITNYAQFKSILAFPYILHADQAHKGFELVSLPDGINFLIGGNFLYICLGCWALLFMKDRYVRNIFVLWSAPPLLFFCGYIVVTNNPVRFILPVYYALLAAFVCGESWSTVSIHKKILFYASFLSSILLVAPIFRLTPPFPFDLQLYSWGKSLNSLINFTLPPLMVLISIFIFRKQKPKLVYSLAFWGLFYIGSPHLLYGCCLFLLGRTLFDWGKDVYANVCSPMKSRGESPVVTRMLNELR